MYLSGSSLSDMGPVGGGDEDEDEEPPLQPLPTSPSDTGMITKPHKCTACTRSFDRPSSLTQVSWFQVRGDCRLGTQLSRRWPN